MFDISLMQKTVFKFLAFIGGICFFSAQAASIATTIVTQESTVWVLHDGIRTELSERGELTTGDHIITSDTGRVEVELWSGATLLLDNFSEAVLRDKKEAQTNGKDNQPMLQILSGSACVRSNIPAHSTGDFKVNIGNTILATINPTGHICLKRQDWIWSIKLLAGSARVTYSSDSNLIGLSQVGTELEIDDFGSYQLLSTGVDKSLKPEKKPSTKTVSAPVKKIEAAEPVSKPEKNTATRIATVAEGAKSAELATTAPTKEIHDKIETITPAQETPVEAPAIIAVTEKPAEAPTIIAVTEKPAEAPTITTVTEKPAETPTIATVTEKPAETPTITTVTEKPVEAEKIVPEMESPVEVAVVVEQVDQLNTYQSVDIKVEIDRAVKKYYAGYPYQAIAMIRPVALSGDAKAQYLLGNILYSLSNSDGFAITEDPVKWYKVAAAQEYPEANYALGTIYQNIWINSDDKTDLGLAISYYEQADKFGHKTAKISLNKLKSMAKSSKKIESLNYTNSSFGVQTR